MAAVHTERHSAGEKEPSGNARLALHTQHICFALAGSDTLSETLC